MPIPHVLQHAPDIRLSEYIITAHDAIVPHYHTQVTDLMYCLEGEMHIHTSIQLITLQQGQHAIVAPMVIHHVTTPHTARYLLVQYGGAYDFIKI